MEKRTRPSSLHLTTSQLVIACPLDQLSWFDQAEFAGFCAAEQQGYYAEEGFQVSFIEGRPEVDFITAVADGTAQFGVALTDLILTRADGKAEAVNIIR